MSVVVVGRAAPPLQEAHASTWALLRSTAIFAGEDGVSLVDALRETATWHAEHNPLYRRYCELMGFVATRHLDGVVGMDRLPHLTPELLRQWPRTGSVELGTVALPTVSGALFTDLETQARAWTMLASVMEHEGLVSARPVHHILFARPPGPARPGAESLIAHLAGFAPPGAVTHALADRTGGIALDAAGVAEALRRASMTGEPVRLIGLPALIAHIARACEAWPVKLGAGSLVLTSGGWDGMRGGRPAFRAQIERALGVPAARVLDVYRLDEHAATYVECPEHHFHAPVFTRVRAVDPVTLRSVREGDAGVLSLMNPGSTAMPAHALLSGDVGRMVACGCGRKAPAFEVLGRGGKGQQTGFAARLMEMIDR